ncbi:hypothetical protein HK102_001064 [Quaeritorhiza haematococci]|nr:hypothetical protein HK102_001064 [Quaeritorhiza haematococci]
MEGTLTEPSGFVQTSPSTINVFVTGATGLIGYHILQELLQGELARSSPAKINVFAAVPPAEKISPQPPYDVEKIKALGDVEICEIDMEDKASLLDAMKKVRMQQVILVSPSNPNTAQQLKTCIDAALEVRLETAWAKQFYPAEQYLKTITPNYTIVRNAFLAQNLLWYDQELQQKRLPIPTDGYFAPLDVRDLARVVVKILSECHLHTGKVYEITGPKVKHGSGIAKAISKATTPGNFGTFQFVKIAPEEAKGILKSRGLNDFKSDGILSFYEAVEKNEMNFVSPDYEQLRFPSISLPRPHSSCFIALHVPLFN